MVFKEAKDILDLVAANWNIATPAYNKTEEKVVNGGMELATGWTFGQSSGYTEDQAHSGDQSILIYENDATQTFSTPIPVSSISSAAFFVYNVNNRQDGSQCIVTYSDDTTTVINLHGTENWSEYDLLSLLNSSKSVESIQFVGGTQDFVYIDDVSIIVDIPNDLYLALDEFNPNNAAYQLVFANKQQRNYFVAPNVNKKEQDILVECHVRLPYYNPDTVDTYRAIFVNIKKEVMRILEANRFTSGAIANLSGWTDNKSPHGYGTTAEPSEFLSRFTVEMSYYESVDSTSIGTRVASVTIIGNNLLGLIDASWEDRNPFVEMPIPKGPIVKQDLIGPTWDIVIQSHDWNSIKTCLFSTAITGNANHYPINSDGSKTKFSTAGTEFSITLVDQDASTHAFTFTNVRVKNLNLAKSTVSGLDETVWVIKLTADLMSISSS